MALDKPQKQKILVLAHSSSVGGAELALSSLMASTGDLYDWHVVFPSKRQSADSRLTQHAPTVSYLELPWWCYEAHDIPQKINKSSLQTNLDQLTGLAQSADILLTNTITIPWLGFIADQLGKPHIWYVHEFGDIDHGLQFIAGYGGSLKMISLCSSRVMTIGDAVKGHIAQEIPANKIDIIHQSIDLANLTSLPLHKPANHPQKFLCMGAIKPSKGQWIAAEAIELANGSSDCRLKLDIVGPVADEKYYSHLKATVNPLQVTVHAGFVDSLKAFKAHDAVVMCSENEALGRVTLEALAAGKIVVGYDCLATRELLGNNRGILYSPNSPAALSEVLSSLSLTSKKIDRQAGREFVVSNYSANRQSEDFVACVAKAYVGIEQSKKSERALQQYMAALETQHLFITGSQFYRKRVRILVARAIPRRLKNALSHTLLRK